MSQVLELPVRRKNDRLLISDDESVSALGPIIGYAQEPLLPLIDACEPLVGIVHDIIAYVSVALEDTPHDPANGLTHDESASIRLYTMEWTGIHRSLYSILNHTLKTAHREDLRPWFKYIKLFLTALYKIPCVPPQVVWRGVRKKISNEFPPGTQVIWWAFSSCTTTLTVLESDLFLGHVGERTLFSIEVFNGRDVSVHSYVGDEEEILMLPGTYMEVKSQLNPAPDLWIIHLKQKTPKEILLEHPFEGVRLDPKNKRHWYRKKRFFILISLLAAAIIVAVILASVLGSRHTTSATNMTDFNGTGCGWSDETFRAVGDWAIDAGSSSNWNLAEPLGLMHETNANSCVYSVDIHGLKTNIEYNWKVIVGDSWDINWGCVGRDGPNCQFNTSTGSIRLKIVTALAYPLTAEVIDNSFISTPSFDSWPSSSAPSPSSTSSKKVFAHYMVGFAFSSDQSFFDGQIKQAKAAGIDGFALNVGIDYWQPDRVTMAFAAAKNNGDFLMFISFDISSLGFNISALSLFQFAANHSNYFNVNGRPFYSTFSGEGQDDFWSNWKSSSGLNPYFCPCWSNYSTSNLLQSHPVADCIFTWNAWPAPNSGPGANFDISGDVNLLASAKATGKKYMAPLSPWLYTHVWGDGWNKNWLFGSEKLLPERWQQIISLQPDFVQIITWNDYSESSYVCSISSDEPISMGGITDMINNPQNMTHDAWLQLSKHYIQWYKNKTRPAVTQDQFYWWYRIHPKNNVTGDIPLYRNDADDCVLVHSIVKSVTPNGGQYTMVIDLNGSKTSYNITELEQTECVAFPSNPGYVTISMIGPDNNVWWAEGKNVPQQSSGNNFNAFSNSHTFTSP